MTAAQDYADALVDALEDQDIPLDQLYAELGHGQPEIFWAGAFTCSGHDNREALQRLPSVFAGMEEASTNLELKAADATCNPHLAVGGLTAAGLDALERGLEPPEPVEVDPRTLPEDEREPPRRPPAARHAGRGARRAGGRRDADRRARARPGRLLPRRAPLGWQAYSAADEAFEQQGHFLKY